MVLTTRHGYSLESMLQPLLPQQVEVNVRSTCANTGTASVGASTLASLSQEIGPGRTGMSHLQAQDQTLRAAAIRFAQMVLGEEYATLQSARTITITAMQDRGSADVDEYAAKELAPDTRLRKEAAAGHVSLAYAALRQARAANRMLRLASHPEDPTRSQTRRDLPSLSMASSEILGKRSIKQRLGADQHPLQSAAAAMGVTVSVAETALMTISRRSGVRMGKQLLDSLTIATEPSSTTSGDSVPIRALGESNAIELVDARARQRSQLLVGVESEQ